VKNKIIFFHKSNYFRKMFKKYKIKIKEKFTKINLIIKTEIQDKYIRSRDGEFSILKGGRRKRKKAE